MSCQDKPVKTDEKQEVTEAKTVTIRSFSFPDFSPEAQKTLSDWREFKTLFQILVSIVPEQRKQLKLLQYSNPDSLYVLKRLYINHSKNWKENANINRDWQNGELPSDTIYQLVKQRKNNFSSFGWEEFLLNDIPYTFSFRTKPNVIKNFKLLITRQKDQKVVGEEFIRLDSLEKNELSPKMTLTSLANDWVKVEMNFQTPLQGNYLFSINYNDTEPEGQYILLYRSELLLPVKYQSEIEKSSEKFIRKDAVIRSSYNGIYFWLFQLEDEFKQLWAKQNFPEKLNTPAVKSRLRLFQTYVEELSDNVKNNPELTDKEIHNGIYQIRETFASVIRYINFLHQDNLEEKMKNFLPETTIPE